MEDDEETCVAANRCRSVQEAVVSCFVEVNKIKSLKGCRPTTMVLIINQRERKDI